MPLTPAERQHRYRERLRRDAERWEAFLENDKKRRAERKIILQNNSGKSTYD